MANVYVNLRPTSFNVPLNAPLSVSTDPMHNGGGGNIFGSNGGVNGATEEKEIQSELLVSPQVTHLVPLHVYITPLQVPSHNTLSLVPSHNTLCLVYLVFLVCVIL